MGIEFREGTGGSEFTIGVPVDKILNIGYSSTTSLKYSSDVVAGTGKLTMGSATTLEIPSGAILQLANTSLFKTTTAGGSINEGSAGTVLTSRGTGLSPEWKEIGGSSNFQNLQSGTPTSGTKDWDLDLGYNAELFVPNTSATDLTLSNWTEGKSGVLIITGISSAFTFPSGSIFAGGLPTLTDNQTHVFSLLYKSATELIWSYGLDFKA